MKQILTALFVITAGVATAGGEGRYITVTIMHEPKTIIVTDTKLGKFRVCMVGVDLFVENKNVRCEMWQDTLPNGVIEW